MSSFVLVHSPLVGPTTWRWVADELRGRGHRVVVPAVPGEVTSLGWEAVVDSVADQAGYDDRSALVGHSGAGPLLPQIAARAHRQAGELVFVDAAVPPASGLGELMPSEFLEQLQALADDGVLPRWSEWFGPGVMEQLIPDVEKRAAVCAELPTLPLSYFDGQVTVPTSWSSRGNGYIRLSESYIDDAAEAASRGWPVVDLPGTHLDIVTRPVAVTEAILSVLAQLGD